jgi:hypothetical protein
MAVVVMMAPVVSAVPACFRGRLLRTVLDRCCGAGIAQRHRLGALGWRGQHEQCADCGKAQNSRNVHAYSPWVIDYHASAVRPIESDAWRQRRS